MSLAVCETFSIQWTVGLVKLGWEGKRKDISSQGLEEGGSQS